MTLSKSLQGPLFDPLQASSSSAACRVQEEQGDLSRKMAFISSLVPLSNNTSDRPNPIPS